MGCAPSNSNKQKSRWSKASKKSPRHGEPNDDSSHDAEEETEQRVVVDLIENPQQNNEDTHTSSKDRKSKHSKKSRRKQKSSKSNKMTATSSSSHGQPAHTEEHVLRKLRARKAVFSKGFVSEDEDNSSSSLLEDDPAKQGRGATHTPHTHTSSAAPEGAQTTKTEKEVSTIVGALSKCYLFNDINDDQKRELARYMWKQKVAVGEVILSEGTEVDETSDFFYVIEAGTFDFYMNETVVTSRSGKGSTPYFGELALLYDAPRAATAKCVKGASRRSKSATLWAIDRQTFRHIIASSSLKSRKEFQHAVESIPMLRDNLDEQQLSRLVEAIQLVPVKDGQKLVKKGERGDVRVWQYYRTLKSDF